MSSPIKMELCQVPAGATFRGRTTTPSSVPQFGIFLKQSGLYVKRIDDGSSSIWHLDQDSIVEVLPPPEPNPIIEMLEQLVKLQKEIEAKQHERFKAKAFEILRRYEGHIVEIEMWAYGHSFSVIWRTLVDERVHQAVLDELYQIEIPRGETQVDFIHPLNITYSDALPDPRGYRQCIHPECGAFDGPRHVECRAVADGACAVMHEIFRKPA